VTVEVGRVGTAGPRHAPVTPAEAALLLAARDPVIAGLVREVGLAVFPPPAESPFAALVRSVVRQQLGAPAARAIHGRLVTALDGDVVPRRVLATAPAVLRACGLSGRKAASLHDLAAKALDGTVVLHPRVLAGMTDAEIVSRLLAVRGIGPWSAQLFLVLQLHRPDVWPVADRGVRRGYGLAWQVGTPTPRQLDALGRLYRPYRSAAAWYCWRALELYAGRAPGPARATVRNFR
jgi:DNA-3-methyladenine glycosylase II